MLALPDVRARVSQRTVCLPQVKLCQLVIRVPQLHPRLQLAQALPDPQLGSLNEYHFGNKDREKCVLQGLGFSLKSSLSNFPQSPGTMLSLGQRELGREACVFVLIPPASLLAVRNNAGEG